jgi:2-iminoacetate synthase
MNNKIINSELIENIISETENSTDSRVNNILNKALKLKGINFEETAVLLNVNDNKNLNKIFKTALKIKQEIYGNRLVLFAPLYISNYCANNCLYCGFRKDNREIKRIALTLDEIKDETQMLLRNGHKRILMLMGEHHNKSSLDFLFEAINKVYETKDEKGNSIKRINIEIAPLEAHEFQKLKEIPIGTYTVFQETYHPETYKKMHPSGPKSNYDYRLEAMDRALANGMHDVGIGALFGLYDYKYEVLGLIMHSNHLDKKFNVGPHTISIPRIYHARNAPMAEHIPHPVSDTDFKKLVAVLRISVPYTGMILSTREPVSLRKEIFNLGVSQISAGSRTTPGGYKQAFSSMGDEGQFSLNDTRSAGEVIADLISHGFIPSFCTACYRLGRVGEDFMDLAKPGLIKLNCHPNALLTLKEYLVDYADIKTKMAGNELIRKELNEIPSENRKNKTIEYLERIESGERDLYF